MATPDDTITRLEHTLYEKVRLLGHPDEVLAHPNITAPEKREVLAAWASDAHGVVDAPGLRQIDSGAIVSVDEILTALRALDECGADHASRVPTPSFERRRRPSLAKVLVALTHRSDDDDDPPPSPAAALPPGLAAARRRRWEPSDAVRPMAA